MRVVKMYDQVKIKHECEIVTNTGTNATKFSRLAMKS